MRTEEVKLEVVVPTEVQIEDLYSQLIHRNHKISHTNLLQYKAHENFVNNHPYRAWFIIKHKVKSIGNVYIQFDNSIGLNCIDQITEKQIKNILRLLTTDFKPLEKISSIRFGGFFLNVASSNIELQEKLKRLGLIESQRSFLYVTESKDRFND
tara:strand:- start:13 stop:474 length:462 start_codon:yes stop_codon:yes gene_type:complete